MDRFKEFVPENVRDCVTATVITVAGCTVVIKLSSCVVNWISKKRVQRRWKKTPKDVVILHRFPPVSTCPNASPFVVKLETYLRMANIPYENDLECGISPTTGKSPWISLNGEHLSDSQLCIEFLAKKFEKRLGAIYTEEQRAVATMARIMLDEHLYWGLVMWRYMFSSAHGHGPDKVFKANPIVWKMVMWAYGWSTMFATATWLQGMGRHSEEKVAQICSDDLRALSKVLGNKKFILGDEPCEDDCAIFGELAQVLWCMPGSPYEKLVNGELTNLREYCLRMKDLYWPDWEDCCAK